MSPLVLVLSAATSQVLAGAGAPGGRRLTPAEEQRMLRLRRAEDRDDFLAAHLLVRVGAARLLGIDGDDISIVQRCPTCGGPHGRPEVAGHPGLGLSLAHSRGAVAAAAATVPVGVDIEAYPPGAGVAVGDLAAALTAAETAAIASAADPARALLLAWVRKEACLKVGLVDLDRLDRFDLSGLPFEPASGDRALRSLSYGGWGVHDWWDGRVGAVGAVAAPAGAELRLADLPTDG